MGTWYNARTKSSIQQSMVENLLTYITHITSETAIEEPDDLSQYGLDHLHRLGDPLLSGGVLAAVCAGPFLLSRSVVVAGAKAAASAVYFGGSCRCCSCF